MTVLGVCGGGGRESSTELSRRVGGESQSYFNGEGDTELTIADE